MEKVRGAVGVRMVVMYFGVEVDFGGGERKERMWGARRMWRDGRRG